MALNVTALDAVLYEGPREAVPPQSYMTHCWESHVNAMKFLGWRELGPDGAFRCIASSCGERADVVIRDVGAAIDFREYLDIGRDFFRWQEARARTVATLFVASALAACEGVMTSQPLRMVALQRD